MPVSVVVGGQFGSEGKGKVALEWVRKANEDRIAAVRVGGPNSGHTGYDRGGRKYALRQLPAAAIDRNVDVVFPAGSFIDVPILLNEIGLLDFPKDRIFISPYANIITDAHKDWEKSAGLLSDIGSTGSGVGAAVMAAIARGTSQFPLQRVDAQLCELLERYICDTTSLLRTWLSASARVIIEGTQGFGLSLLDGGFWPKATSRLTTASGALAESGLSPIDVDDVTLVIRTFPIRVAGQSGPLPGETSWAAISEALGSNADLSEYTTVTNKLRRVAEFDPELVRAAIRANNPSKIVLNHLDYVKDGDAFVESVEQTIDRKIDFAGLNPQSVLNRSLLGVH